ncbi:MAG: enoyl-CoA hydratase/isomerase family protein, partial [Vicinamibacteria bacterium]
TLNRPEVLNALDDDVFQALRDAIAGARSDRDTRVFVLTGAGRAFCAGGDIQAQKRRFEWSAAEQEARLRKMNDGVVRPLAELPIPTIASVNGDAMGGGLGLALACDMRLAADTARFGFAFLRIGLSFDMGVGFFLPRAIGLARAAELAYTGEIVGAEEALRMGLVNRVVSGSTLAKETDELARRIAAGPPLALRATKALLRESPFLSLERELSMEAKAQSRLFRSEDYREGVEAFLEKRKPDFRGG